MTVLARTGFAEYRRIVMRCYDEKKYGDALAVAGEAAKKFPEYDAKTSFWIACMQSRLGRHDDAIRTLSSANDRGIWWPQSALQDSDLDFIRDRPDFKTIQENSRLLRDHAPKALKPELMIRVPADYPGKKDWPAVIMLHQRYGERPELSAEEWFPVLSNEMILAAPWSSQVYTSDGRCWDDREIAEKDVKWAYSQLSTDYRVDQKRLVLGGFSQGAALSISAALKRLVPCRGFVAVASSDWVRPEEKPATERKNLSEPFANFVKASDCRGLRGVMIVGDKDPFFSKVEQLHSLMVERGLVGRMIVERGVGHEYPHEFGTKLIEAVNFVLTGSQAIS